MPRGEGLRERYEAPSGEELRPSGEGLRERVDSTSSVRPVKRRAARGSKLPYVDVLAMKALYEQSSTGVSRWSTLASVPSSCDGPQSSSSRSSSGPSSCESRDASHSSSDAESTDSSDIVEPSDQVGTATCWSATPAFRH